MIWFLYELLYIVGFLLYLPRALWRRRLPHEGWTMRLGCYPARVVEPLGGRRPGWLPAGSVGAEAAARALLRGDGEPGRRDGGEDERIIRPLLGQRAQQGPRRQHFADADRVQPHRTAAA